MHKNELRKKREALQMTQAQLAKALGVDSTTISRWERGVRPIPTYLSLALQTFEQQSQESVVREPVGSDNLQGDLYKIHKGKHIQYSGPWVSLMKTTCSFHLNGLALEALGHPTTLVLLFDRENRAVGFMPASERTKYTYDIMKYKTHKGYMVSGRALFVRYEIDSSFTRTYPAELLEEVMVDGSLEHKVLVLYLNGRPQNIEQLSFLTFKGKNRTSQFIRVTLRKHRAIGLNGAAYEALGKPGWLVVKWDPLRREILLIPSGREDIGAYKVGKQSESWKVNAEAILRQTGINRKRGQVFKAWMRDGSLVIKADLGTPIKGNGRKLITVGRPPRIFTLSLEEFNSRGIREIRSYYARKSEYPPGWYLAKRLGISRATLYRHLDRLNLPTLKSFCEFVLTEAKHT